MSERDYDIVLFGATGFTGKMSVEYLAKNYSKMRIAIGGRDKGKLENIQRETKDKFGASFDVVVADSNNSDDLDRITKRTKVVASLVGPYLRYGTKLVQSCVKNGSHYVDLTGESVWVKQIQEKYHEEAKRKNVKIVNFCGFDSIPSDMSVFLMNNLIKEKFGEKEELDSVTAVYSFNGPLAGSGGTIESMINILSLPFKTLKEMASPFYMCQNVKTGKSTKQMFLSYHKESEMWNSPFIMAAVNEQVVRKSNDLRGGNYGKNLNYGESMGAKSFKISFISFLLSIILPIFFLLMKVPVLKDYLRKLVPKPSEGPTRQQMEKSRCNITYYGKTTSNKKVYANVQFNGDPGYLETSKMISEAAIVLANGEDKDSALKGGILTPATALGNPLAERLNKANIKIKAYLNN